MKITFQIPKADPEVQAKLILQQWVKLKEPKSLFIAILLSVPFMILGGAVTIIRTRLFLPVGVEDYGFQGGTITFNFTEWRVHEGKALRQPSIQAFMDARPQECRFD